MTTNPSADALIGRLVDGRYRVRARIARGGMATVYVATDLRLERRIALKVMHGHLSDDSVFQSRFIQEARAAARLADPNVVNVYDQGQDDELAYLVMEYLPGITLRELLREQRRLSLEQTVTIMHAVLSGLAAAHRAGIIHRDVKPENVLLAEDGRIKIGDFGLARAASANTATGQQLLGTIAYLAPELVTRGMADARSDIYALGIMLYEMLTGEQPYRGEQPMQIAFQHATESVPRPSIRNAAVPESLDELVLWATEKDPEERPADARDMLTRLQEIEQELGISPLPIHALAPATTPVATYDSGDLTRVMPSTLSTTAPTMAVENHVDNASRLRSAAQRRQSRGGWLLTLTLVLALIAGGVGWWFGSGPGSQVSIPDLTNETWSAAAATLREDGLVAIQDGEHTLAVARGLVVRTDPAAGERVDRDSTVRVYLSLGPAQHTLDPLQGRTIADVSAYLGSLDVLVAEPVLVFSSDAGRDAVIASTVTPAGGGEAYSCDGGCEIYSGDTVTLLVSIGPVPGVEGRSVEDATRILTDNGLVVSNERVEEYHETIAEGDVIGIADKADGSNWRPDDTVQLVISQGPEPVAIPSVYGLTIGGAVELLRERGFEPETVLPELLWNFFTATGTDPAEGTLRPRGTEVRILGTGG